MERLNNYKARYYLAKSLRDEKKMEKAGYVWKKIQLTCYNNSYVEFEAWVNDDLGVYAKARK